MKTKPFVTLYLAIAFCLVSCMNSKINNILLIAESVVEEYPDSTLKLLNTVKYEIFTDYQRAVSILLEVKAKNKLDSDISKDTVIFDIINIFKSNNLYKETAEALLYSGRVSQAKNDYEKAMEYCLEAEKFAIETSDDALKGLISSDIAWLNYLEFNLELAIRYYKEANDYFEKSNKLSNIIASQMMIGNGFLLQKDKDSAFLYYDKALELSEKYEDISAQSDIKTNIGVMLNYTGDYSRALLMFNDVMQATSTEEDSLYLFKNTANSYYFLNKLDSAVLYADMSFHILENNKYNYDTNTYLSIYMLLSLIEEERGNYTNALKVKDKYISISDSIYKDLSDKRIVEIQEKYKSTELENKLLLAKNQQKLQVIIIIIVCLLLSIIGTIIYRKQLNVKEKLADAEQTCTILRETVESLNKENVIKEKSIISGENNVNSAPKFDKAAIHKLLLIKHFRIEDKTKVIEEILGNSELSKENKLRLINKTLYDKAGMITFELLEELMPEIINCIAEKSEFSQTEICICCLLYLEFSNHAISTCLEILPKSLNSRCTDIRRKLNIKRGGSIKNFLIVEFD